MLFNYWFQTELLISGDSCQSTAFLNFCKCFTGKIKAITVGWMWPSLFCKVDAFWCILPYLSFHLQKALKVRNCSFFLEMDIRGCIWWPTGCLICVRSVLMCLCLTAMACSASSDQLAWIIYKNQLVWMEYHKDEVSGILDKEACSGQVWILNYTLLISHPCFLWPCLWRQVQAFIWYTCSHHAGKSLRLLYTATTYLCKIVQPPVVVVVYR